VADSVVVRGDHLGQLECRHYPSRDQLVCFQVGTLKKVLGSMERKSMESYSTSGQTPWTRGLAENLMT